MDYYNAKKINLKTSFVYIYETKKSWNLFILIATTILSFPRGLHSPMGYHPIFFSSIKILIVHLVGRALSRQSPNTGELVPRGLYLLNSCNWIILIC